MRCKSFIVSYLSESVYSLEQNMIFKRVIIHVSLTFCTCWNHDRIYCYHTEERIGIVFMKELPECSVKISFLNVMICTFLNVISKKVVTDFEKN